MSKTVTIFGGTGFIGSQIVREMAEKGHRVKIACRVPERGYSLKSCGAVGQIVPVACDYSDRKSIAAAVEGADFVVNTVGVLYEKKKGDFTRVHMEFPREIAKACKKFDVKRFVHVSALGVDKAGSEYAASKLAGEKAVTKAFPAVSILRPSIVFGPDDSFFNMFAELARFTPVLPLIGGGHTKFQPVYVGDVADAVMACVDAPAKTVCGQTFELGGPEVFTFRELFEVMFKYTRRPRMLVSLPYKAAKIEAFFLQMLPKPLLTMDQVESLKTDNVVADKALKLTDLWLKPTGLEQILPSYMETYCRGGKFSDKKRA
jgi:uncharacterized protein YbjT (DUF2867 family)